jgi:hypothetical protein
MSRRAELIKWRLLIAASISFACGIRWVLRIISLLCSSALGSPWRLMRFDKRYDTLAFHLASLSSSFFCGSSSGEGAVTMRVRSHVR